MVRIHPEARQRVCRGQRADGSRPRRPSQEKQAEITEAVAKIDAEYKEVIEKNRALEGERRKTLDEMVEVDLYTVKPTDIHIKGENSWEIWEILYNDGNGIIRDDEAKPMEA